MGRLLVLVVLFGLCATTTRAAKSVTKTQSKTGTAPKLSSAIIAIQVVDPNENKTSTKNSKRTIDQALGYGYQSAPPKYEVYKYSQHDIPPFKSHSNYNPFSTSNIDIQKSVEYRLPTINYVQPGTTLFSTINQNGQVSKLSSSLPQTSGSRGNIPVPVIILRVFPGQLSNPNVPLHPNLPQSHPFASNINQLDVQSLLSKYVSSLASNTYLPPQQQQTTYHQQTPSKHYLPKQQTKLYLTSQQNKQYMPTQQNYQQYQYYQQYQTPPQQYEQYYQSPQQDVQYQQQYADSGQQQYEDATHYNHQQHYDVNQQYYQQEQPQYQQYQYQQYDSTESSHHEDKEARPYSSSGLLTHENYPSEKHTKVVFKTKKGEIKTASTDPAVPPTVETKTIKIHLPENIANVQVQETYEPQSYQQDHSSYQTESDNYYYIQEGYPSQQASYQEESSSFSPYRIDIANTKAAIPEISDEGKSNTKNYHTKRRVKNKKRNNSIMKPRPVREENVE